MNEFKELHGYKRFKDRKYKKARNTYVHYNNKGYRWYDFIQSPQEHHCFVWPSCMRNQEYKDIYKLKNLLFVNNEGYKFKLGKKYINCSKDRFDKHFSMRRTACTHDNNFKRYLNKTHNCGFSTGREAGNSMGYNLHTTDFSRRIYNKYFTLQDCSELLNIKNTELALVYKYKNNKPIIKELEDHELCVICYCCKAGRGRFIFKKCRHGKDICGLCAKQLDRCPICRSEK
jgi:hypothetical protein